MKVDVYVVLVACLHPFPTILFYRIRIPIILILKGLCGRLSGIPRIQVV
jgi:hypothetical protein